MSEELRENLAASLQKLLPLQTSIILVLMSYVPLNFAAANNLRPAVGLMCRFFLDAASSGLFLICFRFIFWDWLRILSPRHLSAPIIFACLIMYLLVSNLAVYLNG